MISRLLMKVMMPVLIGSCLLAGCASSGDVIQGQKGGTGQSVIDITSDYEKAGDKAVRKGAFDKALIQYAIALEADDQNADLYYKVGYVHQKTGRKDLAGRNFREVLAQNPEHVGARLSLGLMALRNNEISSAQEYFNRVVTQEPGNWRALNGLGVINDLHQDYASAQQLYKRALEQQPESIDVLNNLGYSLYLENRYGEAEIYFRRVVSIDQSYHLGWSNLALVYMQLGDRERAKASFQRVVEEHQALNNIGYFNLMENNTEAAREALLDAAEIAPSYYALAYRNLDSIYTSSPEN